MEELKKRIIVSLVGLMGLSPLAVGWLGAEAQALAPERETFAFDPLESTRRTPAAPGGTAIPAHEWRPIARRARRQLKVFGSQLCIDLAGKPLNQSFRRSQAELELEFEHRLEHDAIEKVIGGQADLALVSVTLTDLERHYGAEERVFAYLLPALIVHPLNPVSNIQPDQIAPLLNGGVGSWAELGGAVGNLHGYLAGPMSLVESQELTMMPGHTFMEKWPMLDPLQVARRVAADPQALGMTHLAATHSGLRTIAIDGVYPSVHSFRDGSYPYGHALRMVFRSEQEADVTAFLAFLNSDAGIDCLAGNLILPE